MATENQSERAGRVLALLPETARVRAAFPILQEAVYLNTGTYGPMPEPALETFLRVLTEMERGGVAAGPELGERVEQTRRHLAALLGADPEEIAFTRNATDGINLVLGGMEWRAGDEILTSDEEHEALLHPLLYLQKSREIRVRRVGLVTDPAGLTARLEQAATTRTRLVALSHVSCESGARLPADAVCRWAASRNLLTLVDGAHSAGALPLDVRQIGCDFYAGNGHKWLHGPTGTGFFYARRDRLVALSPVIVGAGSLERVDAQTGEATLWDTAVRFECGTRPWTLTAGLGASLEWLEGLGWQRVWDHIAALSGHLKEHVAGRSDLRLLTPRDREESAGLVTFATPNRDAGALVNRLRERDRIYLRHIPHYNAIRVSTAHFNDSTDIARLLDALQ
jgi:L-cysteine/cystine lyase